MTKSFMPRGTTFARSSFAQFMTSTAGRVLRAGAGLGLVAGGLLAIGGVAGGVLAAVGLIPLAAGFFDICLLGPPLGASPRGRDIRAAP